VIFEDGSGALVGGDISEKVKFAASVASTA
jgi:hypothetical protein